MPRTARAMNRSPIQWFLTIAGLSGIASIFLPFTYGISPFKAFLELFKDSLLFQDIWILGFPFMLSVVISASVIRWILSGWSSLLEQVITYLIGISMNVFVIRTIFDSFYGYSSGLGEMMSVIFLASSLITGIFLVVRNHRIGKLKNLSPIMLMQTAYLGNGMFCLIEYWDDWQIGAYLTLMTVIVYAAQMAWISFQKKTISPANT
jgi:hypothetical protein